MGPERTGDLSARSAAVTFTAVEREGLHEALHGFGLDLPRAGARESYYSLPLLGWALGRDEPVAAIEVGDARGGFFSVPVGFPRPDVANDYPGASGAAECGFEGEVGAATLEREFTLTLTAIMTSGARFRLAVVRGQRRELAPRASDGIQPLMLTTTGRTGSTWLTSILGRHRQVFAHRPWVYDPRITAYWLEALRAMTHPSAYLQQVLPDLGSPRWWLGDRHRYYNLRDRADPVFEDWLGTDQVNRTIDMCVERIRRMHQELAGWAGKPHVRYVVERLMPGQFVQPLVWELFPSAREVVLVRDFRDVACSVFAFSEKFGVDWSRPPGASTDADYIRLALSQDAAWMAQDWERRSQHAFLLKYEDLVTDPQSTVASLLAYLGADAAAGTVRRALDDAAREDPDAQREHRTSAGAQASIGRWRRDLAPHALAACEETMSDALAAFGYPA